MPHKQEKDVYKTRNMNAKELYEELLKPKYDSRPYSRMKDWGDDMEIVEEVIRRTTSDSLPTNSAMVWHV